jgi:hypothetical protein
MVGLLQMSDTLIQFYKMRVGYFYGAQVDQIDFQSIVQVMEQPSMSGGAALSQKICQLSTVS